MNSTFTWLNKQGVRAATGFELQREDRFTMSYREGSKIITIEIEDGIVGGSYAILMSPGSLDSWDDGEAIDDQKQEQVLKNIREALAFQGLVLSIE